jgi:hypothetical protein
MQCNPENPRIGLWKLYPLKLFGISIEFTLLHPTRPLRPPARNSGECSPCMDLATISVWVITAHRQSKR